MSSARQSFDDVDGCGQEPMAHRKLGFEGHYMKDQNRCESTSDSGLGSLKDSLTSNDGSFSNPSLTVTQDKVTADLARLELAENIFSRENERKCAPITEEEGYGSMSTQESADQTKTAEPVWEEDRDPNRDTIESLFIQDTDGDTKLHIAIAQGVTVVSKRMIDLAPTPDHLNRHNLQKLTPLHLAVLTNQPDVARHLVRHGAVLEARDEDGNTPLHLACYQGLQACVEALTQPLSGSESISLPFQQIPQDMDIKNYEGYTCMHLAGQQRQMTILAYMYSPAVGADVNARDGISGRTVLHHLADVGDAELSLFLTRAFCANVNATAYNGCTALQLAAGRGHHHVMQVLMDAGGSPVSSSSESDSSTSDDEQMDSFDDFQINTQAVSAMNS